MDLLQQSCMKEIQKAADRLIKRENEMWGFRKRKEMGEEDDEAEAKRNYKLKCRFIQSILQ